MIFNSQKVQKTAPSLFLTFCLFASVVSGCAAKLQLEKTVSSELPDSAPVSAFDAVPASGTGSFQFRKTDGSPRTTDESASYRIKSNDDKRVRCTFLRDSTVKTAPFVLQLALQFRSEIGISPLLRASVSEGSATAKLAEFFASDENQNATELPSAPVAGPLPAHLHLIDPSGAETMGSNCVLNAKRTKLRDRVRSKVSDLKPGYSFYVSCAESQVRSLNLTTESSRGEWRAEFHCPIERNFNL